VSANVGVRYKHVAIVANRRTIAYFLEHLEVRDSGGVVEFVPTRISFPWLNDYSYEIDGRSLRLPVKMTSRRPTTAAGMRDASITRFAQRTATPERVIELVARFNLAVVFTPQQDGHILPAYVRSRRPYHIEMLEAVAAAKAA
jgi:hypothetical protein